MLSINELKIMKCSSCGAQLDIKNPRSKYVSCQYCGTTTDLNGLTKDIKKGNPQNFKPRSFLKLGLIGEFNGITYQIIGRICWQNDYQEWDSEEHKFYPEKWKFDEWLLLSDEGNYISIIEDEVGYSIAQTITPKFPNLGQQGYILNFYTETKKRVKEYGKSFIQYFEGESTYLINIGAFSEFSQYFIGKVDYIAEWRSLNGEIYEIEFFREEPITYKKLVAIFKNNSEIETLNTHKKKKKKQEYKDSIISSKIFLLFGIINLSMALWFTFDTGKNIILQKTIKLNTLNWQPYHDTDYYAAKNFNTLLNFSKKADYISITEKADFAEDTFSISTALYIYKQEKSAIAILNAYLYSFRKGKGVALKKTKQWNFDNENLPKNMKLRTTFMVPKTYFNKIGETNISYTFMNRTYKYNVGIFYFFAIGLIIFYFILK